ncbi:MAG TPA: hypothetical protein VHN98_00825 [Acidimicrobiales bacterium]|nr:hypothetical protein [Acidimicrobiales bacterium]
MATWIAVAAVLAAAAVAGWWWLHRVDSLGRRASVPWISLGVLAGIALVAVYSAWRHGALERRLSGAASELVGARVHVHCQGYAASFVDAEFEPGYVRFDASGRPARSTTVKADECGHLRSYLGSSKARPSPDEVVAVHLLTHEAMHMAGLTDEARAECAAVQRDARTARLLGASAEEAAALARAYWTAFYPRMPDAYRAPDCGAGGSLDEHLPDAPWTRS